MDPETVPWLTAACLAVHRELWDEVRASASSNFMYWEDVDFSYRALAFDARMVVRDDLTVMHDQGGTQGPRMGRAKSAFYYYYNIRNRLLFAVLHLPRRRLLRWLWHTPVVSWEIFVAGWSSSASPETSSRLGRPWRCPSRGSRRRAASSRCCRRGATSDRPDALRWYPDAPEPGPG